MRPMHRVGNGPPIVTFHGGMGMDHHLLSPWLDPLGAHAQVVYFDFTGNGAGPGTEGSTVGQDRWVADGVDVLDALNVPAATVLGHSYGGFLALRFALAHADRVNRLILCNTCAKLDFAPLLFENARAMGTEEEYRIATKVLTQPLASDEEFARDFTTLLPLYFADKTRPEIDRLADSIRFRAGAANAGNAALASYDVIEDLARIKAPTLVLSGRRDWIMPAPVAGEVLAEGIPGAEHVIFEESGHFPFIEEPTHFFEVVTDWMGSA